MHESIRTLNELQKKTDHNKSGRLAYVCLCFSLTICSFFFALLQCESLHPRIIVQWKKNKKKTSRKLNKMRRKSRKISSHAYNCCRVCKSARFDKFMHIESVNWNLSRYKKLQFVFFSSSFTFMRARCWLDWFPFDWIPMSYFHLRRSFCIKWNSYLYDNRQPTTELSSSSSVCWWKSLFKWNHVEFMVCSLTISIFYFLVNLSVMCCILTCVVKNGHHACVCHNIEFHISLVTSSFHL